ncbi:MAG: hypothetical protein JJU02_13035 [Cryomorphaceae bacterium]|nr:hypothetical protein [Cryomorphaceae bacterium]
MRSVAQIISYIFHPSIMPILGVYLILEFRGQFLPVEAHRRIILLVVIGTYLLPLITSIILFRLGYIKSLLMKRASDRKVPFAMGAVFFYFTAQLLKAVENTPLLYLFMLSACITIFVQIMFLRKLKISAHAAGIAGLVTLLAYLAMSGSHFSPHILGVAILGGGILGWARLQLQAHTLNEVIAGYFAGALPLIVMLSINGG